MKKFSFILVLGAIAFIQSCTRIDAGHEGILIKQYGSDKGVQPVSLVTGRVWYNPWNEDVDEFPTFVQTWDYEPFTVNSAGGDEFTVDPTISLYVNTGCSPRIYIKYRKKLEEIGTVTIYNYTKDAFRIQMNRYTTDEIISKRDEFEKSVQESLTSLLEKEGFHLESLTSGLKYPQGIVAAVTEKNVMLQKVMTSRNGLVKDSIDLQSARIKAISQEVTGESLNQFTIQKMFIEKWDGKANLYGQFPMLFNSSGKN